MIRKNCKMCGNPFLRKVNNQLYCSRKCKDKYKNSVTHAKKYPKFRCKKCGSLIQLHFCPSENPQKLNKVRCQTC